MDDWQFWQYLVVGLIFLWTGFVRSGLGFGGAALGLPPLLLVVDDPLVWLPLIGVHLIFFSSWTVGKRLHAVDWAFVRQASWVMAVPMALGVFGLLTLPSQWLVWLVYAVTIFYGLCFLFRYDLTSSNRWVDRALLLLGGYIAGVSLMGAPLIAAVAMQRVSPTLVRNTLFVLWFILVAIKLSVLGYAGVNFWWSLHLWLLPCAIVGHLLGLRLHAYLIAGDVVQFKQVLGAAMLLISVIGMWGAE